MRFLLSPPGGLFGQQAQQPGQAQPTQLYQQVTALSAPTLLGDERDSIFAKWNQLQAYWGTGKGYYSNNNPPVEFTQENPFCRFKVITDRRLADVISVKEKEITGCSPGRGLQLRSSDQGRRRIGGPGPD